MAKDTFQPKNHDQEKRLQDLPKQRAVGEEWGRGVSKVSKERLTPDLLGGKNTTKEAI